MSGRRSLLMTTYRMSNREAALAHARALSLVACTAALVACGEQAATPDAQPDAMADVPEFQRGLPIVVSADKPGSNEGPALLRARDGNIVIAWSAGGKITFSLSNDGRTWTSPSQPNDGPGDDRDPTLYQDAAGIIHMAWARAGEIEYAHATAPDSVAEWGPTVAVSSGTGDEVPSLAADPDGKLVVAFARRVCAPSCGVMASASSDGGLTWGTPESVATDNGTVKNHLPSLANVGNEMVIAWNEYDATATVPWETTTTSAHISTIRKGSTGLWSAKTELTAKTAGITVFPTVYADHSSNWLVAFIGAYVNGAEMVRFAKDVPLATPTAMPRTLPLDGSKPHIVATATPGVFVAAWEDGAAGARDIVVRTYRPE